MNRRRPESLGRGGRIGPAKSRRSLLVRATPTPGEATTTPASHRRRRGCAMSSSPCCRGVTEQASRGRSAPSHRPVGRSEVGSPGEPRSGPSTTWGSARTLFEIWREAVGSPKESVAGPAGRAATRGRAARPRCLDGTSGTRRSCDAARRPEPARGRPPPTRRAPRHRADRPTSPRRARRVRYRRRV